MNVESRLKALERQLATPARRLPCTECGQVAPPPTDPRDADSLREQIGRRLERLVSVPLNANAPLAAYVAQGALPFGTWPRCGTCGQIDSRAMRRQMQGSPTP